MPAQIVWHEIVSIIFPTYYVVHAVKHYYHCGKIICIKKRLYLFIFREKGRGEKERERNIDWNLQPGTCPEPVTSHSVGQCAIN